MIRRFFTRILMVILIAACGYNWLQVRQLQADVGRLRARLAIQSRVPVTPVGLGWPPTGQELRSGANRLKDALDSSPQSRRKLHDLQVETEHLRKQAEALWREAHAATGHHSP